MQRDVFWHQNNFSLRGRTRIDKNRKIKLRELGTKSCKILFGGRLSEGSRQMQQSSNMVGAVTLRRAGEVSLRVITLAQRHAREPATPNVQKIHIRMSGC